MKIKASDLPMCGVATAVFELDGTMFELCRRRRPVDGRKFEYNARMLPALNDHSGWWYRYSWELMLADLKLMAKPEDEQ